MQTEQDARGAGGDLRVEVGALGDSFLGEVEHALPVVGLGVELDEGEGNGATGGGGDTPHPGDLQLGEVHVVAGDAGGGELEDAGASLGERFAEGHHLVLLGEGAGHVHAVDGAVDDGARGGNAERAGINTFAHELLHLVDVLGVGGLVHRAALTHDVGADGAVGHLRAHVEGLGAGCRGSRGTRGRSPSSTACPQRGPCRGCPRRPP